MCRFPQPSRNPPSAASRPWRESCSGRPFCAFSNRAWFHQFLWICWFFRCFFGFSLWCVSYEKEESIKGQNGCECCERARVGLTRCQVKSEPILSPCLLTLLKAPSRLRRSRLFTNFIFALLFLGFVLWKIEAWWLKHEIVLLNQSADAWQHTRPVCSTVNGRTTLPDQYRRAKWFWPFHFRRCSPYPTKPPNTPNVPEAKI